NYFCRYLIFCHHMKVVLNNKINNFTAKAQDVIFLYRKFAKVYAKFAKVYLRPLRFFFALSAVKLLPQSCRVVRKVRRVSLRPLRFSFALSAVKLLPQSRKDLRKGRGVFLNNFCTR